MESQIDFIDPCPTLDEVLERSQNAYQHLLDCHSVALHLLVERGLLGEYAHRLHEAEIPVPPRTRM